MTRFYVMRHGETEWNRDGNRYCGRSDIGLSELGKEQAERAAPWIGAVRMDRIIASDRLRAYETALPAAAALGLPIERDERVTEIDFGRWEGLRPSEITAMYPESWHSWLSDPEHTPAGVSGETASQVFERLDRFFKETTRKHPHENILVVSHSTAMRIYAVGLLGGPLRHYRQLVQSNAGIVVLDSAEDGMRLLQWNVRYDGLAPGILRS